MNFNRRSFIGRTLALGLGASTLGASQVLNPRIKSDENDIYPFYGKHQQGIATNIQKHIYFMVLDLHTNSIDEIKEMFKIWTI